MKQLAVAMMILLTSLSVTGCASKSVPVGIEYCAIAQLIWFDSSEEVDDTPVNIQRQIYEHNVTYERLCEK